MSAQVGHVVNERTGAWVRTVTPINVNCAVYSKARRRVVYVTGSDSTVPAVQCDDADTDLSHASGMVLELHPITPDSDPIAIKRFVDITLNVSGAQAPPNVGFDISVRGQLVRVMSKLLDALAFRGTVRRAIGRVGAIEPSLSIKIEPSVNAQQAWRIDAISFRWQALTENGKTR